MKRSKSSSSGLSPLSPEVMALANRFMLLSTNLLHLKEPSCSQTRAPDAVANLSAEACDSMSRCEAWRGVYANTCASLNAFSARVARLMSSRAIAGSSRSCQNELVAR